MSELTTSGARDIEVVARVKRAATGREEAAIPARFLERHGYGVNPDLALEKWRAEANAYAAAGDGNEPWDDVELTVCDDQAAGYPLRGFAISVDLVVNHTRWQAAVREVAQYLLDMANGEPVHGVPEHFFGRMDVQEHDPAVKKEATT